MSEFDAAIDILHKVLSGTKPYMHRTDKAIHEVPQIEAAIRLLEAAGKINKRDILGWLNRIQTVMRYRGDEDPQDDECIDIIRVLIDALPGGGR